MPNHETINVKYLSLRLAPIISTHHRGDTLFSPVMVCASIFCVFPVADAVDLLVGLGTMVVALLPSTGHRVAHTTRMPGTNARHLAKTLVSFARQLLRMPAGGDTWQGLHTV